MSNVLVSSVVEPTIEEEGAYLVLKLGKIVIAKMYPGGDGLITVGTEGGKFVPANVTLDQVVLKNADFFPEG